jgi:hypothetical protein
MENEGTLADVFYNMSPDDLNPEWWLWFMKQQCQLFVILESQKDETREIVGMCWLNNVVGRRADIHYPSTNKLALDKAVQYGFKSSAIIPKACYIAALGKSVNGHQYHMTRKRSK